MRWLASLLFASVATVACAGQSNVLIVITDDQGYGDLGVHGNPVIKTPKLDAFAKQSVWLKNFYVSPVCSPTRASLLTGQYNYRTGVVDTFIGRSLMRPDVKTLSEYLAAAGYRTGLFGKWHLGDNYPLRPEDRGFQETLWCQGGGLAQPSDPPQTESKTAYFDPILVQNGKPVKTKGYCTDVFTDAAVQFISAESKKPFFAYVAFNAPHGPFQVPDDLAAPYRKLDLTAKGFPQIGQPWATGKVNAEEIARAYGMVENIDTNFGRMMKALDDAKLADDTIVIFMTDNGPGGARFNSGLRNRKGTVYEGGIRVPCYVRWPAQSKAAATIEPPIAHIDVTPTLLSMCGVKTPEGKFDGIDCGLSFRGQPAKFPDRTLLFQWHRGGEPEKYRAFAARGRRYKLVQANGVAPGGKWEPKYELFDIGVDPFEEKNVADQHPEAFEHLKAEYEKWFADVTKKGFAPPRIIVGNEKENPVRLSRQDWRGPKVGWSADSEGHWEIEVERAGNYRVTVRAPGEHSQFGVRIGDTFAGGAVTDVRRGKELIKNNTSTTLTLAAGKTTVSGTLSLGKTTHAAHYIELEYLGPAEKK